MIEVDVRELLAHPGSSRRFELDLAIEGIRLELAGMQEGAAVRGDLLLESVVEGVLVSGPLHGPRHAHLRPVPGGVRGSVRRGRAGAVRRARPGGRPTTSTPSRRRVRSTSSRSSATTSCRRCRSRRCTPPTAGASANGAAATATSVSALAPPSPSTPGGPPSRRPVRRRPRRGRRGVPTPTDDRRKERTWPRPRRRRRRTRRPPARRTGRRPRRPIRSARSAIRPSCRTACAGTAGITPAARPSRSSRHAGAPGPGPVRPVVDRARRRDPAARTTARTRPPRHRPTRERPTAPTRRPPRHRRARSRTLGGARLRDRRGVHGTGTGCGVAHPPFLRIRTRPRRDQRTAGVPGRRRPRAGRHRPGVPGVPGAPRGRAGQAPRGHGEHDARSPTWLGTAAWAQLVLLGRARSSRAAGTKASILADAMEAVLGAVYMRPGPRTSRRADRAAVPPADGGVRPRRGRSRLQDRCCRSSLGPGHRTAPRLPRAERGPDHQKEFTATVYLAGRALGSGTGRSKKEAEQRAAREAYGRLTEAAELATATRGQQGWRRTEWSCPRWR